MEGRSIIAVAVGAIAAVAGITTAAHRNAQGEITEAGTVDAFEIRVGDCFDDEVFEMTEIHEIPGLPCTQPHDNQVYAAFDLAGDDYPGEEAVMEQAYQGCYDRFAAAIGKSYEESVIDVGTIYPTEGSWNQRGDREVLCVGYHVEFEKLTGSILGSGM